uniref:SCAN box domain-containing protein n=1 Tax=Pipistrellus kuhlii TaxID=59472 RepID=A0A7J8A8I3_PIPKU|nr:hypothetical protein mPipKuh1_009047 [Pipistrellus kuhlii]
METEEDPKTQKDREVQNDPIMSPPNEMVAKEPDVLTGAPQAQVPQEPSGHPQKSLEKVCVKNVEIWPGRNPVNPLIFRQMFRKFRYEGPSTPREVFRHLLALARQWLRPDIHTKEQMIKMVVQEQFQIVLREMLRARQQKCPSTIR